MPFYPRAHGLHGGTLHHVHTNQTGTMPQSIKPPPHTHPYLHNPHSNHPSSAHAQQRPRPTLSTQNREPCVEDAHAFLLSCAASCKRRVATGCWLLLRWSSRTGVGRRDPGGRTAPYPAATAPWGRRRRYTGPGIKIRSTPAHQLLRESSRGMKALAAWSGRGTPSHTVCTPDAMPNTPTSTAGAFGPQHQHQHQHQSKQSQSPPENTRRSHPRPAAYRWPWQVACSA